MYSNYCLSFSARNAVRCRSDSDGKEVAVKVSEYMETGAKCI